jgi:hypothetical protein
MSIRSRHAILNPNLRRGNSRTPANPTSNRTGLLLSKLLKK